MTAPNEAGALPRTDEQVRPVVVVFDSDPERAFRRELRQEERRQKQLHQTPEIQFVHTSASRPSNEQTSKLVRAHVMRDYMWKKKKKKREGQGGRSETASLRHTDQVDAQGDAPFQRRGSPLLSPTTFRSAYLYPIPMNERRFRLLQHYFDLAVEKPDREDFVQLSMGEGSLFHMMLLSAVMHLNHLSASPDPLEYDYHKFGAIELVNTRLRALDSGAQIPDATILTIAFLSISDALIENYKTCSMHLGGLYKIIEIRGGLEQVRSDVLQRVRMADIFCSLRLSLQPKFPITDLSQDFRQSLKDPAQLCKQKPSTELDRIVLGVFNYFDMIRHREAE